MIRQSDYENYDYRQFWEDNRRAYEDSAERSAIKKFFKGIGQEGKVFADLGCGFGRLFEEYENFERIIMVDYSLNNLRSARNMISEYLKKKKDLQALRKVFFIAADVNNLPLKSGLLDVCMTVRVIHHLSEPDAYFAEVSRVIKSEGIFILEFANKRNLKNILKFCTGRVRQSPFDCKPLQVGDTILDYHPVYIKSLLKKTGFKVLKQLSVSNLRLNYLKKHISLKILLFYENLYQNLFSFIDTGPSIFLKAEFTGRAEAEIGKCSFSEAAGNSAAAGDLEGYLEI